MQNFAPVLVLLVLVAAYFTVTESNFLTWGNIQNLLSASSVVWVVAMGMTLVVVSGGFDLSVGAIAGITGYALAKMLMAGVPGVVAFLVAMMLGAAIGGFVNGSLVGRFKLNVFVVTLASMTSITGLLSLWSGTSSVFITSSLATGLTVDKTVGLPNSVWIMVLVFLVVFYVQARTYFGRDVYAVGGSLTAARLSGIRTGTTLFLVYAAVGMMAALGGVIAVSRAGAATPSVDQSLPLQAIAAVLLGGTALTGGVGGVGGTALGVLFIGVLQNGLSISGVPSYWQQVLTGVILVVAVMGGRARSGNIGLTWSRLRLGGRRRNSENSTPHADTADRVAEVPAAQQRCDCEGEGHTRLNPGTHVSSPSDTTP